MLHKARDVGVGNLHYAAVERAAGDISTTDQVAIGGSIRGEIQFAGEADWIQVWLTAETTYEFRVLGGATGAGTLVDPHLQLLDASGNWVVTEWDAGEGLDPWLTITPESTGTYYLAVTSYDHESTGSYSVTTGLSPKPVFSDEQIVDQLTRSEFQWGRTEITFSFFGTPPGAAEGYPPGDPEESNNEQEGFSVFTKSQMALAREALTLWAEVCGMKLVDLGVGSGGDIRFGNTTTGPELAWAYMPDAGKGGDVWFNPDAFTTEVFTPGGYGFNTFIHELGHALGFDHPGDYEYGEEGFVDYSPEAEYVQDSVEYSVMSYFQAQYTGADHLPDVNDNDSYVWSATPLLHDILALQQMFGVNLTTRPSDTVYGFNSTAGHDSFDFRKFSQPVVAIWDAGGIDTLDLSGFAEDAKVNLNNGAFTSAGGLTSNIAIAVAVTVAGQVINIIENAVGGGGNDLILGNSAANVLTGGRGGDALRGNGGDDTLYGGADDDQLTGGKGGDTLYGGSGNDSLHGGAGTDRYFGGEGSDLYDVASFERDGVGGGGGVDVVKGGLGEDVVSGGPGGDELFGNGDDDVLSGDSGNDRLVGGKGGDKLFGGDDDDTFVFLAKGHSGVAKGLRDSIGDFSSDEGDRIDPSFKEGLSFIGRDGFSGDGGEVRYSYQNKTTTIVKIDTNGDTRVDMKIALTSKVALTEGDFIL